MPTSHPRTRVLAEFVVIVVSILAAFAVEEYRESRVEARRREVALRNIRAEIEHNIAALEAVVAYHTETAGRLAAAASVGTQPGGQSGFETSAAAAPQGLRPPDLRRAAWQAAQATGAVSLFDYELGQHVAGTYDAQAIGVEATVQRLVDQVFSVGMFRSADAEGVVRLMGALSGELVAQERQLLDLLGELSATLAESDPQN
jgi:hypothetical protein